MHIPHYIQPDNVKCFCEDGIHKGFISKFTLPEDSESKIPTEPQIRVFTKDDFQQAIECLVDVVLTTASCLGETADLLESKDHELKRLCLDAQKSLDKITQHIIERSF